MNGQHKSENGTIPPRAGYDETRGVVYFARMLDKMRLFAAGKLRPDFHANLGIKMDERMCNFLGVKYADVREQTLSGNDDDRVLAWCVKNGRGLSENDTQIWNGYASKLGWNDAATERLEFQKSQNGMAGRSDIITFFQFFDADEGRKN